MSIELCVKCLGKDCTPWLWSDELNGHICVNCAACEVKEEIQA